MLRVGVLFQSNKVNFLKIGQPTKVAPLSLPYQSQERNLLKCRPGKRDGHSDRNDKEIGKGRGGGGERENAKKKKVVSGHPNSAIADATTRKSE
jgi:hypothetical protein